MKRLTTRDPDFTQQLAALLAVESAQDERIEEAVAEIHAAQQLFCKPTVGAFEIAASAPARIAVRYTAPYNCILQEGLFYEVALRYGASDATVAHAECRRRGHDACRFEIRY